MTDEEVYIRLGELRVEKEPASATTGERQKEPELDDRMALAIKQSAMEYALDNYRRPTPSEILHTENAMMIGALIALGSAAPEQEQQTSGEEKSENEAPIASKAGNLATQNARQVEVTSEGDDEVYCEWFKCQGCQFDLINGRFTYCPNCGQEINWKPA